MSKMPDGPAVIYRSGAAQRAIAVAGRIGLSEHILPTAATMVGVCMTVLSIGRLSRSGRLGFFVDKLLAFDSVVFLASAALSFVAIRIATNTDSVETWAEKLFLLGLSLCAVVAVVIALAIDL